MTSVFLMDIERVIGGNIFTLGHLFIEQLQIDSILILLKLMIMILHLVKLLLKRKFLIFITFVKTMEVHLF